MSTPVTFRPIDELAPAEVERFWSLVERGDPGSCWLWRGHRNPGGYGVHKLGGRRVAAHRVAYRITRGVIGDLLVMHECDTPSCVNPDHLRLGSFTDNNRDREAKGRRRPPRGEQHWKSKLTQADVAEIRRRWATGAWKQRDLAAQFGISQAQVWRVIHGESWRHAV